MPNCKCQFPFAGTKEQAERMTATIDSHRNTKGALMPILQDAQAIYGYLPEPVLIQIAEALDISLSEVYGVASFYSQFTFNPKGQHTISVCLGTACYVKGAGEILDKICARLGIKPGETSPDGKFTVDAVRCIGACGLAPVVTIDDEVHGRITVDDVDAILDKYLK